MMRSKGLKRAVKRLAKGKFHSVEHKITEFHTGRVAEYWTAYIDGTNWTKSHGTPELALQQLKHMIKEKEKT